MTKFRLAAAVFGLFAFSLFARPTHALTNKTIGSYDTAGTANDVTIVDNFAYVADGSDGVIVLDVSNPAAPTLAGQYDTPGTAVQLEASGSFLFVADTTSLQILNISTPAAPTFVGSYSQSGLTVNDVTTDDTHAYIVGPLTSTPTIEIINITSPSSPTLSNSLTVHGANAVTVSGTTAYVTGGNYMDIVNVSPTLNLLGTYTGGGFNNFGPSQVVGSYAYVQDLTGNIDTISVANPASPTLSAGSASAGQGINNSVSTSNGYIFVTDFYGLSIYDIIANPGSPAFVDTYSLAATGTGVVVADTTAIVTMGSAGVQLLDVSKPDTVPPTITLTGSGGTGTVPPVVTVGGKYVDPGYSGSDNIDGSLTVTVTGKVDSTTVGKYTLTYTATDRAGNVTKVTRVVIIAPSITTITGKSGAFVQTVNGKKFTMRPFASSYRGTIIARKLVVHTTKDPLFLFVSTSATGNPNIVLYNSKGGLVNRTALRTFSTRGLKIDLASDPSTLSVMMALTPVSRATTVRMYAISKNGIKGLGSVTAATKASTLVIKLLKYYSNEIGLGTMVSGQTKTIRIWRYSSSKHVFLRDTKYSLSKLKLGATSITLR